MSFKEWDHNFGDLKTNFHSITVNLIRILLTLLSQLYIYLENSRGNNKHSGLKSMKPIYK